jgi:predicted DNA-binding protein
MEKTEVLTIRMTPETKERLRLIQYQTKKAYGDLLEMVLDIYDFETDKTKAQ